MANTDLCKKCLSLVFGSRDKRRYSQTYRLTRTFDELQNSALTLGCPFCVAFIEQIPEEFGPALPSARFRFYVQEDVGQRLRQIAIGKLDATEDAGDSQDKSLACLHVVKFRKELDSFERDEKLLSHWMVLRTYNGDWGEKFLERPDWNFGDLDLDTRFRSIDKWLSECIGGREGSHRACSDIKVAGYPSRLLDLENVPSAGLVALTETRGWSDPLPNYVTLSHCWGPKDGPRPLETTGRNLEAHKQGLLMNDLPKTFRDAIEIALRLKQNYLWIDSLCIIQDNREDWEFEAAKMAAIYENAFLTIAATSSVNCEGGCGLEAQRSIVAEGTIPRDFDRSDLEIETGREWRIRLKHTSSRRRNRPYRLFQEPPSLHTRGWVLQEAYLSRRVLHMAHSHMLWQCRACFDQEVADVRLIRGYDRRGFIDVSLPEESDGLSVEEHKFTLWWTLINDYTGRRLTYLSDRSPAFAGIIEHHSRSSQDTSLLGLWRKTIALDLAWSVKDEGDTIVSTSLPTWTWLSTSAHVELPDSDFHPPPLVREYLVIDSSRIEWRGKPYVSMLLQGTLDVSSKSLRVHLSTSLCSSEEIEDELYRICKRCCIDRGVEHSLRVVYRNDITEEDGTSSDFQITCLLLHERSFGPVHHIAFLALLPAPSNTSMYVRIGSGQIDYFAKDGDYHEAIRDRLLRDWEPTSLTLC